MLQAIFFFVADDIFFDADDKKISADDKKISADDNFFFVADDKKNTADDLFFFAVVCITLEIFCRADISWKAVDCKKKTSSALIFYRLH